MTDAVSDDTRPDPIAEAVRMIEEGMLADHPGPVMLVDGEGIVRARNVPALPYAFKLRAGERSPGPRQALQAAGRTGRRDDVPLAPYVGFDGERHERGAANALLCGCEPPMPREKVDQRDAGVAGGRYANAAKRCRPDAEECARQVAYTRDDVDAAREEGR